MTATATGPTTPTSSSTTTPPRKGARVLLMVAAAVLALLLVVQGALLATRDDLPGPWETADADAPERGDTITIDSLDLTVLRGRTSSLAVTAEESVARYSGWTLHAAMVWVEIVNDTDDPREIDLSLSHLVDDTGRPLQMAERGFAEAVAGEQAYTSAVELNPGQSVEVVLVFSSGALTTIDHLRLIAQQRGPDVAPREAVVRLPIW